jgi:hypothetical protein
MKELDKLDEKIRGLIVKDSAKIDLLVQLEIAKQLYYIMSELNELRKIIMDK